MRITKEITMLYKFEFTSFVFFPCRSLLLRLTKITSLYMSFGSLIKADVSVQGQRLRAPSVTGSISAALSESAATLFSVISEKLRKSCEQTKVRVENELRS